MVRRPFLGVMGTVEPVFANLQNKGMRRFTLRGQKKVSAQWKRFTMVHNIEKVAGVTLEERGACVRIASGFFYGLVGLTSTTTQQ